MQHKVTNNRILNVRSGYQWLGLYLQHEVTNGRNLLRTMRLPMVGTLQVS